MLVAFSHEQGLAEVGRGSQVAGHGTRLGPGVLPAAAAARPRAAFLPTHGRFIGIASPSTPAPLLPGQVGTVTTEDQMDDGTPIRLAVTVDRRDGSATFDFEGAFAFALTISMAKRMVALLAERRAEACVQGAAGALLRLQPAAARRAHPHPHPHSHPLPRPSHSAPPAPNRHRPPGVWQHQRAARGGSLRHHLRAALPGDARHPPQPRLHGPHQRAHP